MIEKALVGDRKYWGWIIGLSAVVFVCFLFYLHQLKVGLGITGMSRDVSWGFYISQFTFLVGVAASAVMVVLPYYLHNTREFGKMTILGEFLAIPAVIMCMLFIFVDMGQPFRILFVFLYPTPHSMMFWDTVALGGYLLLNIVIGFITLESERKSIAPPKWIKPVIYLSIPWAVSIHTVTAFLYSGLAARHFWLSAIMAPRFLATAFSSGPALLILLSFLLRKIANYDVGKKAVQKLAVIVTYAMILNVFFLLMEAFTAFYSHIPEHELHFDYLYFGVDGKTALVPWMWISAVLAVISLILLIDPKLRRNEKILGVACVILFLSIWIDKGLGMIVTGFIPSVLGYVVEYSPTFPELVISVGVYGIGILLITLLYKIALSEKKEVAG